MLFNSFQFMAFFIVVFALYLMLNHMWQNRMLLLASNIFYGAWDYRFLGLIWLSICIDYYCGRKIHQSSESVLRKRYLYISIGSNLIILGFFKYFNFFISNAESVLHAVGVRMDPVLFNIVLPVGISFYTFQALSYTIDIYRKQLDPAKSLSQFMLYVMFFPQLVAGPIERATSLMPQLSSPRTVRLRNVYDGVYLIYWGLFLKVVVADNLAQIVDPYFDSSGPYTGIQSLLVTYAFAIEIFCDFAGYSEIARGLGKCMGVELMVNFSLPYFSKNPNEFWKNWHISLSSWLRDYLYIPMGGNRYGRFMTFRNLFLTMFLGGLWHGASWTFIAWGIYHGFLLIAYLVADSFLQNTSRPGNFVPSKFLNVIQMTVFFHLTCIGWVLFRSQSLSQAVDILSSIVLNFNASGILLHKDTISSMFKLTWLLLLVQIFQYSHNDLMITRKWPIMARGILYFIMYYYFVFYGMEAVKPFIYFQF